jgi:hypothetical protein
MLIELAKTVLLVGLIVEKSVVVLIIPVEVIAPVVANMEVSLSNVVRLVVIGSLVVLAVLVPLIDVVVLAILVALVVVVILAVLVVLVIRVAQLAH